ncbi:MAG: PRC-barrel domain containing protein [Halobacteriales archaeon]|nr:PRC-barrel domain containing protein [Halobacteriales archaeon]
MPKIELTKDDEGKQVVDSKGGNIGMVSKVRGGKAHVNPDPDITDRIRSKLGWGDADEDTYALETSRIKKVTDDEIHLKD